MGDPRREPAHPGRRADLADPLGAPLRPSDRYPTPGPVCQRRLVSLPALAASAAVRWLPGGIVRAHGASSVLADGTPRGSRRHCRRPRAALACIPAPNGKLRLGNAIYLSGVLHDARARLLLTHA